MHLASSGWTISVPVRLLLLRQRSRRGLMSSIDLVLVGLRWCEGGLGGGSLNNIWRFLEL